MLCYFIQKFLEIMEPVKISNIFIEMAEKLFVILLRSISFYSPNSRRRGGDDDDDANLLLTITRSPEPM